MLQAVVYGRYASLSRFIVTGVGPIKPLVGTATVRRKQLNLCAGYQLAAVPL